MSELIPDAAVKAIQDSVKVETIVINGAEYVSRQIFGPPRPPFYPVERIKLSTLESTARLILENNQTVEIVHVASPTQVLGFGYLQEPANLRQLHVEAIAPVPAGFQANRWYEAEELIILLRAGFQETPDRDLLLTLLSNLREEGTITLADDGVSQVATVRRGVSLTGQETVKPELVLRPFRTFPEIEQPASKFIFRLRAVKDGTPQAALFSVLSGEWEVNAMTAIATHLQAAMISAAIEILGNADSVPTVYV